MTMIQYIHISFEIWGSIFCIIAALCIYVTRSFDQKAGRMLIYLLLTEAILNINEAFAYYFRGNETSTGYVAVRVTNFVVFVCSYLLGLFTNLYMGRIIERRGGREKPHWNYAAYVICGIGILLLVLSQICHFYYAFDEHNRYYRLEKSYWIMIMLAGIVIVLLFIRTMKNIQYFKFVERIAFITFELIPVVALVVQLFYYGWSISNLANTITIIFIFIGYEIDYANVMIEMEKEICEERIRLLNNQIQPHFIYNSLTAIRSLCEEDSKAAEALEHFSGFLRGSMSLLMETKSITAERELTTVENYLYMEKHRFEDKLTVIYDIRDKDFMLPAFTIQTLVENAIRHGIRKKKDGKGIVTLRTYMTKENHIVEVEDDGVGFAENNKETGADSGDESFRAKSIGESVGNHIGIENLKKRLSLMCAGTLDIQSAPGVGTLARVYIPKVRENGEKT